MSSGLRKHLKQLPYFLLHNYPKKLKAYNNLKEKNKTIEKKEDKVKLNAYHSPSPMNELCDYICTWEKKNILWDNNLKNLMDTRVLIVNNDLDLSDKNIPKIVRKYINGYADELKAHINMSEQIKNHEVEKTYIALVKGTVKENEATINMPIGRSTKDRKKMAVTKKGKEAITHFKVLERYTTNNGTYTLLEIRIDTGRTHQIRVHMSYIGHPLLGDSLYTDTDSEDSYKLHCNRLSFDFIGKGRITIECPPDFYTPKNEKTTE